MGMKMPTFMQKLQLQGRKALCMARAN